MPTLDTLPDEVSDAILATMHILTLQDTKEMLVYRDGIYEECGEQIIEQLVEKTFKHAHMAHRVNRNFMNEVLAHVRWGSYTDRKEFDKDENIIHLANGLLDIRTGKVSPETPDYYSRIKLPVVYDPEARAPAFEKALAEILPDEEARLDVMEEFAAVLWRTAKLQKAFMWVGNGRNGKSTLLYVLQQLIGPRNFSSIAIQDLQVNRFKPAELDGKLANIYSDISATEIHATGIIKSIISGDSITVEKKNRDPFTFRPFSKLFYSANQVPEVLDSSDAWFRRWKITEFIQEFEKDKCDPDLPAKLTSPQELSGILNLVLATMKDLIARSKFAHDDDIDLTRESWMLKADHLRRFIDATLEQEPSVDTPRQAVYDAYTKWCYENGIVNVYSQRKFNDVFKTKIPVSQSQPKPGGKGTKSIECWRGVKFKDGSASSASSGGIPTFPLHGLFDGLITETEKRDGKTYVRCKDHLVDDQGNERWLCKDDGEWEIHLERQHGTEPDKGVEKA
jgi:putative DNA primase/helicase